MSESRSLARPGFGPTDTVQTVADGLGPDSGSESAGPSPAAALTRDSVSESRSSTTPAAMSPGGTARSEARCVTVTVLESVAPGLTTQ